ncbi:MAG: exodeoxyribonuclease V subunit gamma [Kiritimatiellia bacterium]
MSLKIFCGDNVDGLAAELKAQLARARRTVDPFHVVQVVVPNGNVAKWLQVKQFSKEPSLCAGIEFPFIERRLTELLAGSLPDAERERFELLPDHSYVRAILSILLDGPERQPEYAALAVFRRYLLKDDEADRAIRITDRKQAQMAWQLADKLANLMDSYEVHRPEIVEAWLGKAPSGRNPKYVPSNREVERAEAALARALWGAGGVYSENSNQLSLRQLFDKVRDREPAGEAERIYFFGLSTLSQLQVRILMWLARKHEVVFFHNNLCREYWGDITTMREDRRLHPADDPEADYDCDNDLLKRLGCAGRETLRLLVDAEEANGMEEPARRIAFTWEAVGTTSAPTETVLQRVQESIRARTRAVGRCGQDASIQVIGTPGIRREVEMVYNSILGSVARPEGVTGERPWPDCTFSDIAVLVPDMATYRPIIEAVFEARGQVPYGLIDTTASEDSQFLRGFLALVELGRNGLNRGRLFDVLENPCVQRALGFTREDVADWRELTKKLGAFDGFEHDAAQGYFDWSWALRRLRLASVANRVTDAEGEIPLVKDSGEKALKLSEVVELLYRDLRATFHAASGIPCVAEVGDCWAERLMFLAKNYLAVARDDRLEEKIRQTIQMTLYSLRGLSGACSFELPVAVVEMFAGGLSCRRGGYLTSGVTIAGLMPMRPVPFRQVYVVGLGAGGFPGQTSASTLDVRGAGWRLGDVSRPNMNRFLFLETLMSVRDRLVLSYPNRDIEKDAELFPSEIIRDVEEFLSKYVLTAPFEEFGGYPLLERGEAERGGTSAGSPTDPVLWRTDDPHAGLLPTYSEKARELARELAEGAERLPRVAASAPEEERVEISARALAEFIRDPVRAVMRHRYGISPARYLETDLENDSPVGGLEGLDRWAFEAKLLEAVRQPTCDEADRLVEAALETCQRSGALPGGFLGAFAKSSSKPEKLMDAGTFNAVSQYVAGFGLSDGETNTLHLRIPTELAGRKVRLVAEVPNWKEEGGEVSVLVTGTLDDEYPKKGDPKLQKFPGARALVAFLAFLMRAASSGAAHPATLRVGQVDLTQGYCGTWVWDSIGADAARGYLDGLIRAYLECERGSSEGDGKLIDLSYEKIVKALPPERKDFFEEATKEDYDNGKASYNDLAIEQNLRAFRRPPTEAELRRIVAERYALPLSGVRQEGARNDEK